ncbi:glycosyltransferase [Thermoanaerobacter thermocopriae]|nr:glycosyltransferase [Thermoanaerobacter thermocopriae]
MNVDMHGEINIAYLSDYPFGIGFGGKEIQLLSYMKYTNEGEYNYKIKLLDFWDKNSLNDVKILHLFGFSNWFYFLIKTLKANKNLRIVISPTMYFEKNIKFEVASFMGFICPIPNFFKYTKFIFENVDVIITNSFAEKDFLVQNYGHNIENKIEIVYNAIEGDFNVFSSDKNVSSFVEKYNIDSDYILSVGFFDERKNTISLIKAFIEVYPLIKKKLVLIGDFRFAKKQNKIFCEQLINNNKDKIIHIPYIDKTKNIDLLKSAYYNCSYHVLPSKIETPGISNLEAASFGKNIIAGDCKPVREYFLDKAYYCNPKSIEDIKEKLIEVNGKPQNNKEIKKLVIEKYTYNASVQKLIKIYEKLLNN